MKHVRGFKYPSCVANDRGTEKGGRGKKKKKGGECAMHLCLFELGGQLRAPEYRPTQRGNLCSFAGERRQQLLRAPLVVSAVPVLRAERAGRRPAPLRVAVSLASEMEQQESAEDLLVLSISGASLVFHRPSRAGLLRAR